MNNIHPTETGGDGKSFVRFATPKKGDPVEDKIHCAMCGFPVRMNVDAHGDAVDSPGITIADEIIAISNDQNKIPIHLQGLTAFSASSRTLPVASVNSGCRLCGTYNPTGKQSREFDTFSKDMSNR
jgi:hypothetical protein